MQIHDRFDGPQIPDSRRAAGPVPPARRRAAQEAPSVLRASIEGSLFRELQGLPELRSEQVAQARAKLESGEYLTAAAANATAGALLNAQ